MFDEDGQADIHGIHGHGAVHGKHLHTGSSGGSQRSAESGIGDIVGMQVFYIGHLNDEQHISAVALLRQCFQTAQVLGTAFCGCIGEGTDTVIFQRDTLDFQKALLSILGEGKVETGIAMEAFCLLIFDFSQTAGQQPFFCCRIGCLRIHIDQPVTLAYGDQIVSGFAGGIRVEAAENLCAVCQQFPAAAGVFHVDGFFLSFDFYFCNKTVGTTQKPPRNHGFVFQVFTTFRSIIIADFRKKRK